MNSSRRGTRSEPHPSPDAARLVSELQDLHRGPLVLSEVIALGTTALPALEAVLRGPSQGLHHPRSLAADAIGAIGGEEADAVLIRALSDSSNRDLSPLFQEAEAVVVSHIVTHLGRHHRYSAIEALLESMRQRPGSACAEALGELCDPRAIPLLVRSLSEDAVRRSAMNALRRFGREPILPLRALLARPRQISGVEPPTNIDARAAAATLLGELGEMPPLFQALEDRARAVRVAAAMSLIQARESAPPRAALEILIQGLGDPNWDVAEAMLDVLARCGPGIAGVLDKALRDTGTDDPSIRRHGRAAILAGRLGISNAAHILANLSGAGDAVLRFAAIRALTKIRSATEQDFIAFLPDPVLGIALEALRALRARRPFTLPEVSDHLRRSSVWQTPWRRWRRLWALRKVQA